MKCRKYKSTSILYWVDSNALVFNHYVPSVIKYNYSGLKVIDFGGSISHNGSLQPRVLSTLENQRTYNDNNYVNDFINKSRKIVWINVINQQTFDRNYECLRKVPAGKILNVVVNDNISKSPMLVEPNTIYTTREDYYDSFFIEMLVEKINDIAC